MESRASFNSWVHKFGISLSLFLFVLMSAFPVLISFYYGVWPNLAQLWPAAIAVILFMAPWWPAETVGYMSVMGPGALYMSYITGNVTNLRMPATVGTINSLEIEPGSDACHTMAIIICGASIITTVLIVAIGVLIAIPLKPLLESPAIQPAFKFVVPAIFGGLVAQTILKTGKSVSFFIIGVILCLLFCFFTKINSAYYMLIVLVFSIILYLCDYRISKK
ncbi:hypothetical protein [Cloacibacillus sp.]|uniref:hypothetical protein n=1 Tax=Cloacibacillus sp. TaxID=2049023 RepID=UPI0025BC242F|nr:hypothetical protein [Cloacibacillus sp.]MCC8057137.1 hypothetical protein [Cloacibacillus sp.]